MTNTKQPIDEPNVLYGGPVPDNYLDGCRSLGEILLKRFTQLGDHVALIDGVTDERVTSIELRDRSVRAAEALRALGIGAGDTVAICSENRLEFAYVMFGTILLGAQLTPMNPTYTERELHHAVSLSRPQLMFASKQTATAVKRVAATKRTSAIRRVIVFDPEAATATRPSVTNVITFADFLANPAASHVPSGASFRCDPVDMDQHVSVILYSSGTTGLPKGVELTQISGYVSFVRFQLRDLSDEPSQPNGRIIINITPFFHTFGYHVLLNCNLAGETMVTLPNFEPHTFLRSIQKYKATNTYVAPPLMVFLAKSPLVDQYDLSSLQSITCGAAPLSAELEMAVRGRLNNPVTRQGYGMTEGTVTFTCQENGFSSVGSVGVLMRGIYGRVVDPDTGRVMGAREEGELQFRGTSMKSYIGDPKATSNMLGADGWLRTGDIGYYDEKGEWYVVDRLKELIKYKGFQVPPAEIEGLLLQHPSVADVGVIGVPDERAGELTTAFVVKQPNATNLSEQELIDFVAKQTSPAKHLHGGVRFVAQIPKLPSGKILRRELRTLAKTLLPSKL